MRVYNDSVSPIRNWSGKVSIDPYEAIDIADEDLARALMKTYSFVKELKQKRVRMVEKEETVVEEPTKREVKKKAPVRKGKRVIIKPEEFFRGPDYIEKQEKRMKKLLPVVRIGKLKLFRKKPYIRYE